MIRPVSDYVKSVTELANFIGIESDQIASVQVVANFFGDVCERRAIGHHFVRDAMNRGGSSGNGSAGVDAPNFGAALVVRHDLHDAQLHNAVVHHLDAGGF